MTVVEMVAVIVVVVVVKVLAWAVAIIDMVVVLEVLFIDMFDGVGVIVVGVIVIVLKVPLSVPYSVDVPPGVVADSFMGASTVVTCDALTGIGVGVLAGVNTNAFAVIITALEFPVSTPLEGFSR